MKKLKNGVLSITSKIRVIGEKGAGTVAETLLITLFAVLITGGVATLIYNAVSDKGNEVTSIIRSTGNANAQDLDGDGKPNGLVLVGISQDQKIKYWRPANPTLDYGMPGANLDDNDDGDYNEAAGDNNYIAAQTSATATKDTIPLVTTITQDNYFSNLGADRKSEAAGAKDTDPHNASVHPMVP